MQDPLIESSPVFAISQQFVVLYLPAISLLYQTAGVHTVGSDLKGMDLPATPDRKINVNQKLFGLGGTRPLLLGQISLFASQSVFGKGERA